MIQTVQTKIIEEMGLCRQLVIVNFVKEIQDQHYSEEVLLAM